MTNKQRDLIQRVKEIFDEYGDLDSKEYDDLDIPDKPCRKHLRKMIGVWQVVRDQAGANPNKLQKTYLQGQNEKLLRDIEKQRNVNQIFIDNCLAALSKVSFFPAKIPRQEKATEQQEFHSMKSDDHVGELVESTWVQGVNEYNIDLFKSRLQLWMEKVMLFREQDKRSLGLNKLIVYMLGDHVTGETVYHGQSYMIDAPVVDQFMTGMEEYTNTFLTLAQTFPQIEIFCVPGNHGRPGRKGDNHPKSNFDYLLFRMMKKVFEKQDNINVYVSECPTMLIQNGCYNFALNHNDDTRGWNGIPYYGLDRKARRLGDLYGMQVHYKLGGHFHSPANLNDETLLNGTMVGGSDLSVNQMRTASLPSQKIFYFDKKHGINRESNIYLAVRNVLKPDDNGIYTAYV